MKTRLDLDQIVNGLSLSHTLVKLIGHTEGGCVFKCFTRYKLCYCFCE